MKKRRIKLAVVGSASIDEATSKKLARAIATNILPKYELVQLVTIKEDPVGKEIRRIAKAENIPTKTYSEQKYKSQSTPAELVAGSVLWATTNYILVHNGDFSWAQHLGEMLTRHGRRYKLLQVSR